MHYARVRRHGDPGVRLRKRGTGTTEENFWDRVEKTPTCWIWTGLKYRNGYGQAWDKEARKNRIAHRLSWELTQGPIANGMQIDHMCHNRACVNPAHLRVVNQKQNSENLGVLRSDNSTGFRGVRLEKRTGRYYGRAYHYGREYSAGTFDTAEEAHEAAKALRNRLFTHNNLDRMPTGDAAVGLRPAP